MGAPRWAPGRRRVDSALPKSGEATLLSTVWSVGRIRLERVGQGPLGSLCGLSELQAQLGASLRRLVLTFCCQWQCHPKKVIACRPGWGWQQGPEKVGTASTEQPKSEQVKARMCRARREIQEVQVGQAANSPTPQGVQRVGLVLDGAELGLIWAHGSGSSSAHETSRE